MKQQSKYARDTFKADAGKRIYVSGDTEDNEDVLAIRDIDIAFVCCNKPYTMTVEQCANVVKAIRPE